MTNQNNNDMTNIDALVLEFISKYQDKQPNAKFHNQPLLAQKRLASRYCRFNWAVSVLKQNNYSDLLELKAMNKKAKQALKQCNLKKLDSVANRACTLSYKSCS